MLLGFLREPGQPLVQVRRLERGSSRPEHGLHSQDADNSAERFSVSTCGQGVRRHRYGVRWCRRAVSGIYRPRPLPIPSNGNIFLSFLMMYVIYGIYNSYVPHDNLAPPPATRLQVVSRPLTPVLALPRLYALKLAVRSRTTPRPTRSIYGDWTVKSNSPSSKSHSGIPITNR